MVKHANSARISRHTAENVVSRPSSQLSFMGRFAPIKVISLCADKYRSDGWLFDLLWREPRIMLTTPAGAELYLAAAPNRIGARAESVPQSATAVLQDSFEPSASRTDYNSYSLQYTETTRLAVSAQYRESAGDSESEGNQLHFSFYAESQRTFLASFQERIQSAAAGKGAQGSRLLAAGNVVQMRFKVSGSILGDFARVSEQAAKGSDGFFGDWMDSVEGILATPDDQAGLLLELLDRMFGKNGELEKALRDFLSKWQNSQSGEGAKLSFQSIQLEFEFEYVEVMTIEEQNVQSSDPIVLDLDGNGISLTSHADGAMFDITGRGESVKTAFVRGGDAFLAWDRNGNGRIDDGRELFGDQWGACNGFEELAKLDDNGDGIISAADKAFGQLLLFRDNGNGRSEPGELISLGEAGIAELHLGYVHVSMHASGGNRITQISSYRRTDGSMGHMADALLNYTA